MYASMRSIQCSPGKATAVAERIAADFVPQMRELPGFVSYSLVDIGKDQVSSISIFADQAGAETANKLASSWVQQSLADIIAGPLEARAGEVLVNATA